MKKCIFSWLSLLLGPMAITRTIITVSAFVLLLLHYSSNMADLPRTSGITAIGNFYRNLLLSHMQIIMYGLHWTTVNYHLWLSRLYMNLFHLPSPGNWNLLQVVVPANRAKQKIARSASPSAKKGPRPLLLLPWKLLRDPMWLRNFVVDCGYPGNLRLATRRTFCNTLQEPPETLYRDFLERTAKPPWNIPKKAVEISGNSLRVVKVGFKKKTITVYSRKQIEASWTALRGLLQSTCGDLNGPV